MAFQGPVVNEAIQRILTTGDRNVVVCGSIIPNGTSTPSLGTSPGVYKVIRTAAGKFKVTLKEPWKKCITLKATLGLAAAADRRAIVQSQAIASTDPSFVVWVVDSAGVAQDVAAATDNTIYFSAVLQNGAIQ